jgi:predicted Zn-dependent protease
LRIAMPIHHKMLSPRAVAVLLILALKVVVAGASWAGRIDVGRGGAPMPAPQVALDDGWHPATLPPLELYFVGIGDLRPGLLDELVDYFGHRFGIRIGTLSPLMFDPVAFDTTRRQSVADELIAAVRRRYPGVVRQERTRIIAVTPYDMYMRAMANEWTFTFSLRSPDKHSAVVSYARMDPLNLGMPPSESTLRTRLRKMVMKNIGIMFFGLGASDNPRSVMYRNILGVDDLDRMTEFVVPR